MAVHKPAQAKAGHAGHTRPNQPYFDPFDMKVWLLGSSALLMPISKGVLAKPLMHEEDLWMQFPVLCPLKMMISPQLQNGDT